MVNLHNHKFYCTTISFTDIQDMMRKDLVHIVLGLRVIGQNVLVL